MLNNTEYNSPTIIPREIVPLEIKIVRNTNLGEHDTFSEYIKKPFFLYIDGEEITDVSKFSIDLDTGKLCNGAFLYNWKYNIEKTKGLRYPDSFITTGRISLKK